MKIDLNTDDLHTLLIGHERFDMYGEVLGRAGYGRYYDQYGKFAWNGSKVMRASIDEIISVINQIRATKNIPPLNIVED